jgi:hypothetical protein
MTIYRITFGKRSPSPDMDCDIQLPRIHCDKCRRTWQDGMYQYPAFKFPFLSEKIFSAENIVSVPEFKKIEARIQKAAGRPVILVPGASIGELSGTTVIAKLPDFTWGTIIYPQISLKARDTLAEAGIELLTATCTMLYRGKRLITHLAIQAEPVPLLPSEWLSVFQIRHCPRCNDYDVTYPRPKSLPKYEIPRGAWPKGQHLVTMLETLDLLATEHFRETVLLQNLQGLEFIEAGRLV